MAQIIDRATLAVNHVLAFLPPHNFEQFRSRVLRVPLVSSQMLADYDQHDDHVLFIERGVVSIMSEPLDGEDGIQVAMVGREGMIGNWSLINTKHAPRVRAVVHVPGTAFRVAGSDLREATARNPALHEACARFSQSLMTQIMHTATCNARRSLVERCSRWLVMVRERLDTDEVRVTHEALSATLGMRRSGVTVAAATLQQAGLIRTGRGRFIIVNLEGLRELAQGNASVLAATAGRKSPAKKAMVGEQSLGAVL